MVPYSLSLSLSLSNKPTTTVATTNSFFAAVASKKSLVGEVVMENNVGAMDSLAGMLLVHWCIVFFVEALEWC